MRFGSQMLPVTSTLPAATQLSVYAGRADTNTLTLFAINKSATAITATVSFPGAGVLLAASTDVASAGSLGDQAMSCNGVAENALNDDLSNAPSMPAAADPDAGRLSIVLRPYALTLLHIAFGAYRVYVPRVMR